MSDLVKRAKSNGTPLIDGNQVTFVWLGKTAPQLFSDWLDWDETKEGISLNETEPGVWTYTCKLPSKAYLEYRFFNGKEFVEDPMNPYKVYNGINGYNNTFSMPKALISPWIKPQKGSMQGKLSQHVIEDEGLIIGLKRKVYLYQPPAKKPAALLVVWDGPDYLKRGGIIPIVENLMAAGKIPPLALALLDNAHASRMIEYDCSEVAILMLTQLIIPLAQKNLNILNIKKNPGAFGVLGASMGGIMAAYTGVRLPHIFGHVLSQSGAFILWDSKPVIWELIENQLTLPLDFWLNIGTFDLLYQANKSFRTLLDQKGYAFMYKEYAGGHNYTSWRNELAEGLIYQFG
jgi:enterochelin esterase-like enzyme